MATQLRGLWRLLTAAGDDWAAIPEVDVSAIGWSAYKHSPEYAARRALKLKEQRGKCENCHKPVDELGSLVPLKLGRAGRERSGDVALMCLACSSQYRLASHLTATGQ